MRATKISKTNTLKKSTTLLSTTQETNTSSQTPIEIALKIDENGMTTLRNLYEFLGLNLSHYSSWCKRNILNNPFAIEGVDYIPFRLESENPKIGGRPTTDYKLTSDFAKQLSMTVKNERGQEARKYFIACEQGLKIATEKLRSSINTDKLSNAIENMNITLSSITDRLTKLEEKEQTQTIETTYKKPYNPWFAKMQPKYKLLEEYFDITRGQLYKNILWELENSYSIDTQQIQADYCYENNLISCYPLEPYEFVPKYRDMIEQIINSNLIKYGIADENDPITSTKHITIFDTPIVQKQK